MGSCVAVQIAPEQLKDLDVPWVILGHSERRSLLKESNEFVGEKTANALAHGLKVIGCIGETLEQRESGQVSLSSWALNLHLGHRHPGTDTLEELSLPLNSCAHMRQGTHSFGNTSPVSGQ